MDRLESMRVFVAVAEEAGFAPAARRLAMSPPAVTRAIAALEEGLDVAIRIAHLADSSLSAVRVGSVRRVVCASPRYLAEHGIPRAPADLSRFEVFDFAVDRLRADKSLNP